VAPLIYLDTHVAAWLYAGRIELLPQPVRALLEEQELLISPAVELELQYLFEIRRAADPARQVVETLEREIGLKVCNLPFPRVVEVALAQSWTRDPFDRLIVSQASLAEAALVSKDRLIRDHYPKTFWSGGEPESPPAEPVSELHSPSPE
jgi:PIN domain nuclease of toxin-antitoxin system